MTPNRPDFLTIQNDAAGRFTGVGGSATSFPLLAQWINEFYHYLNTLEAWTWTENTITIPTVVGANNIATSSISQYYKEMKDVTNLTNQGLPLKYAPIEDYDTIVSAESDPNPPQGYPRTYSIWDNTVYLLPNADKVYNIQYRFYAYDPDLVNDTDVPNLPLEACSLLAQYGYKMLLQQSFLYDQANVQMAEIARKIQDMRNNDLDKQLDANRQVRIVERPYNKRL